MEEAKAKLTVVRGRIATRLPDTHESIQALDLALWLMDREALVRAAVESEREIEQHNACWQDFVAEFGDHAGYSARSVLGWLGY